MGCRRLPRFQQKYHSLIVVLDSDLEVLKVIDYPDGSEGYLGGLISVAFGGDQYVYVSGILGIAKFSLDGDLVALNRDVKTAAKIVYGYGYLYAFRVEYIKGYLRHVLYIYDTDLSLVKKYVLSESIDADSYFDVHGRPALEGGSIYVAGFDKTLGIDDCRIVVYSLSIESAPALETTFTTTNAITTTTTSTTSPTTATTTHPVVTTISPSSSATPTGQATQGAQLGMILVVVGVGVIAVVAVVAAVFVFRKR